MAITISRVAELRGTSFPTTAKEGDKFFHETLLWEFEYRVLNGVLQWGHRLETNTSTLSFIKFVDGFNLWLQTAHIVIQAPTPPYDGLNYRSIYLTCKTVNGANIAVVTNGVGIHESSPPVELTGDTDGFAGAHYLSPILIDPRLGEASILLVSTKAYGSPGAHSFSCYTTVWYIPQ